MGNIMGEDKLIEVKDLILYQVATDRYYKVGDVLTFGETYNGQGNRINNSKFNNGEKSYYNLGYKYLNSKNIFKNKNLLFEISNSLSESDFVIRELAAEEVRKELFSNYPSRLKCMFLSDKKEVVLDNLKVMYKKGFGTHFQAIAVKLNGKLFYAKNVGLQRNGLSYGKYKDIAREYWSQDQDSNDETKEILFEGKAEVVEILGEYDHKR